ncbi:stage V sporulation protein AD [Pelagirhabdus alkalitolerans]|uniref:Stage V sporulation protein AD n=1 Tax=Pelagirhabdus alkalitolerans TaxID=1612202 RepID=A0A1G6GY63_9BACI|nr:stage V sporulation protein AD [Pelagirhabdus alkalitolerans]SDB86929.1 stage V sporulation protein AD [Pelagirhabdus alkalitolerans]
MKVSRQSWQFENTPSIRSSATTAGPFEAKSKIAHKIDLLYRDLYMEQSSYEKGHQRMIEDAVNILLRKEKQTKDAIDLFISGDLINQMTPTNFAATKHSIPFIGLFNACATTVGSLALSAALINAQLAESIITGGSSHYAAVEKQFRYPNEYGAQKPPTSQWTVTGAGFGLISHQKGDAIINRATIGKIADYKQTDPFNMGAAMAPAAYDTITTHLKDFGLSLTDYDVIVTGDLGQIGQAILFDMLEDNGFAIDRSTFIDCGLSIYNDDQNVFAGGSGSGCSSLYLYSHLLDMIRSNEISQCLMIGTGALLSPLSALQKQTIPAIAHAVSIKGASL